MRPNASIGRSERKRERERAVFHSFVEAQPRFGGEPLRDWRSVISDPPDILCTTKSGNSVGVELAEWVHESEIGAAKQREGIASQIFNAIGRPQPINKAKHFDMVLWSPRDKVRITHISERDALRGALFRLIDYVDQHWDTEYRRNLRQYVNVQFSAFPPLDKYLIRISFHAGQPAYEEGSEWILPTRHSDSFDERTMVDPLLETIRRKIKQYRDHPVKENFDQLILLIYLDQAVLYNSPIIHSMAEAANEVRLAIGKAEPFSRAFLFGREQAIRLW